MFFGAPYAALSYDSIKVMMTLLKPKKGGKLLDLGSGDGRIVIAAASLGLDAKGYEINPILLIVSKYKLIKNESKGQIFLKDYWRNDLSEFDYITVWGVPHMMKRLENKLLKELKPGAKVVSNHSRFPNWKEEKSQNDVYLYIR